MATAYNALLNHFKLIVKKRFAESLTPGTSQRQLSGQSNGGLFCRLTGASFETNGQFQPPPIGEVVTAGNLRGRVVRSSQTEFAVNFLRPDEDDA